MTEKLKNIEEKYEQITEKLSDPGVTGNIEEYQKLMKEQKTLSEEMRHDHYDKQSLV